MGMKYEDLCTYNTFNTPRRQTSTIEEELNNKDDKRPLPADISQPLPSISMVNRANGIDTTWLQKHEILLTKADSTTVKAKCITYQWQRPTLSPKTVPSFKQTNQPHDGKLTTLSPFQSGKVIHSDKY